MMKRFIFSFLFSFSFVVYSQVWFFGLGAGLKFTASGVKPEFDGKIFSNEGCAVANDENNRLLFYTDGITVWDSKHNVMENGEGLNGNTSSTQSALIVQKPGNKNLFYIFTVDEKAGEKGLCYSAVSLKTNGSSVVGKNLKLIDGASEKLTAVLHKNGKDVWIITQNWKQKMFYSFLVTPSGIGNPVLSPFSDSHTENDVRQSIGYLTASPDGKKMAAVVGYAANNNLYLFDFDQATGKISGQKKVSFEGEYAYGLSFSPDNSKLYISFLSGKSGVIQYDLVSASSYEVIPLDLENSFSGMMLGPDEKIYVARKNNFLDLVADPDKPEKNCNYKKNAVDLFPESSAFGLPNNWYSHTSQTDCESVFDTNPISQKSNYYTGISTCDTEMVLDAKNPGADYLWSTRETTQKIKIDTSGIYTVLVSKKKCSLKDSLRIVFKKDLSQFRCLSSFNPEEDFVNSEFYYTMEEADGFELKVFDNKKNLLFKTSNVEKKWSGRDLKGELVKAGDYDWQVAYKPKCPVNSPGMIKSGQVTVKRKK